MRAQNAAIQNFAAKALQLDLTLQDYGPETMPERLALRDRFGKAIDQIWGTKETDANFAAASFAAAIQSCATRKRAWSTSTPSTDEQRQAVATAKTIVEAIGQARLQMAFGLSAPVSYPLLMMVIGWVVFCSAASD